MSEYDKQLPFGTIKESSVSDTPNDPLCYAEVKFKNGVLYWESPDFPQVDEHQGEFFRIKYGSHRERISKELAKKLLTLRGFEWDYAE